MKMLTDVLDDRNREIAALTVENRQLKTQRDDCFEVSTQRRDQIAALTAECNDAKAHAGQFMMPTADFENAVILAQREQIAALTAQVTKMRNEAIYEESCTRRQIAALTLRCEVAESNFNAQSLTVTDLTAELKEAQDIINEFARCAVGGDFD